MKPEGNIDVFVAKLDASGHAVFAHPLRLCGDGIISIAVDPTGRIAVSGSAMGTAVLSPGGEIQFVLAPSGDVAFNSHGDLVIVGSFTTTIDLGDGPITIEGNREGFAIAVDTSGHRLWSHLLAGSGVHANGVAIDSHDNIVITGFYEGAIDLFGDEFRAISSSLSSQWVVREGSGSVETTGRTASGMRSTHHHVSNVSGFLTGISVNDPAFGAPIRNFNDLARRQSDLVGVANSVCLAFPKVIPDLVQKALDGGPLPVDLVEQPVAPVSEQGTFFLEAFFKTPIQGH
jgi:hypothetical protein